MASKKGKGPSKGKQPAKRQPSKRVPVAVSSSDDEGEENFHFEILKRLEALEKAKGGDPGAVEAQKRSRPVRAASKSAFRMEVLKRISALESAAGAAGAGPSQEMEAEPSEDPAVAAVESGDLGEGEQVAVAVQPAGVEGVAGRPDRKRILVVGHSMVFWAAAHARKSPIGSQLGLSDGAVIEWCGRRGLRWAGLLPLLFRGRRGPPPHVVLIHLGGNDLGLLKGRALSAQVIADFRVIKARWPRTYIFWSAMLPRRVWRETLEPRGMARALRRANRAIQKALAEGLGIFLPHPRIRAASANLYRSDGVHLSAAALLATIDDVDFAVIINDNLN
ncbi:uncharacterized protein LOC129333956 [Eublepharis macularius]|uniref:Uncharacterized protein LOC129333956 n=1 Tax=Eublepharis macularius TaxID=481883 RepID=A0AA97L4Q8_EUBMA|nr:uncharacterized protein LOC129333956 [Eublepharis macularius]